MKLNDVKTGLRVTTTKLKSTKGFLIKKEYLKARKQGVSGIVMNYVSGHGGDVWWVEHDDKTVAAYMYTEFNPA